MRSYLLIYVLFLLFIPTCFSYGSNELKVGYVITLNNDTLHGYIDYKKWKISPSKILFKETLVGSGLYFTPKTISEFYTTGEVYKRAIIKLDQISHKTNELQFNNDTVFLKAIILGEKELYYLKDSIGTERFFIKQDSIYEWLIYMKYQMEEKGKKMSVVNNNYIGQLLIYLQNCPTINSVLSETTYDLKSLSKVFYYYYDCTNIKVTYQGKEKKRKLFFWLK